MNKAVFGKTMENIKNRIDLRLAEDENTIRKLQSRLQFKDSKVIDGLHLIELYRKEVVYDKPAHVGSTILDISKVCMMDLHYNVTQKQFAGHIKLLYSDTATFYYLMEYPDIYNWMGQNKEHFDLSDCVRPELRDDANKKKIGVFKDETNGLAIKNVLALNPKVYSFN